MPIKTKQSNIHDGWEAIKLASIFDFKNGLNKEKKYFGQGTPIINYMDVNRGGGLYKDNIFGRVEVNKSELSRFNVKKGDVFFTRTSETLDEIGFSAVALDEFQDTVFSGFVLRARPKGKKLVPGYAQYCFKAQSARKEIMEKSSYTTRALTSGTSLNHVNINLPPLPEQKRIVAVLETWDQTIEKLKRKIEAKKEIKKGLLQELLSGKTRIARHNDEWVNYELEDLLKPTSEKHNPVTDSDYFKCIELEHLQKGDSELLGFTDSNLQKSIKNVFKKGDVLFGKLRPYLRKFLRTEFDGVCSTEIWVLKSSKFIDSNYAYYLVQSAKFVNVANVSSGSRMPRADWDYMKSVNFAIPGKIDEQKAIVRVLDAADNEVRILIKKLSFLNDQKKYLLNNLVTGAIRTPESLSIPK
ncbi:Type I restriction-modification system, specificity subunit S [Candidatus Nitrotoga sp. HW29]|uniref:restriction endonuclease subunit S n=1 Tax=Candidatus Nitrotoga sp. HW29 TaxID=2886963 RepID=UPI001EF21E62|nr:restriction endonuclease subunit S [Candidatus Nitrotoga sp. HW29]CAH1903563.1 Type I restriction-modification system, specificity subunit S [Candidatus Nitrotoga sp. HW29]